MKNSFFTSKLLKKLKAREKMLDSATGFEADSVDDLLGCVQKLRRPKLREVQQPAKSFRKSG